MTMATTDTPVTLVKPSVPPAIAKDDPMPTQTKEKEAQQ